MHRKHADYPTAFYTVDLHTTGNANGNAGITDWLHNGILFSLKISENHGQQVHKPNYQISMFLMFV